LETCGQISNRPLPLRATANLKFRNFRRPAHAFPLGRRLPNVGPKSDETNPIPELSASLAKLNQNSSNAVTPFRFRGFRPAHAFRSPGTLPNPGHKI
jgi:hypothetical protein